MVTTCDTVIVAYIIMVIEYCILLRLCAARVPLRRALVAEGQDVELIDYVPIVRHSGPNPLPAVSSYACTPFV